MSYSVLIFLNKFLIFRHPPPAVRASPRHIWFGEKTHTHFCQITSNNKYRNPLLGKLNTETTWNGVLFFFNSFISCMNINGPGLPHPRMRFSLLTTFTKRPSLFINHLFHLFTDNLCQCESTNLFRMERGGVRWQSLRYDLKGFGCFMGFSVEKLISNYLSYRRWKSVKLYNGLSARIFSPMKRTQ